jgi:hypothetical protein
MIENRSRLAFDTARKSIVNLKSKIFNKKEGEDFVLSLAKST